MFRSGETRREANIDIVSVNKVDNNLIFHKNKGHKLGERNPAVRLGLDFDTIKKMPVKVSPTLMNSMVKHILY